MATRLSNVIGPCIHTDQTGFIQGRYLKSNVRIIMNIVLKAQAEMVLRFLLFLDAEKFFDSIKWQYLFSVVENIQVAGLFSSLVTLYRHQAAIIDLEQHRSEKIMLQGDVRQSCPLSPLLFALALELLASAIHHGKGVKGIQASTEVALYADDAVCFLEHPLTSAIKL